MRLLRDRQVLAWSLYDWANSAFATTVMAGFFPVFFKSYWSQGAPVTESTFHLGVANSLASLTIALMAPVIGAMADRGGWRKRFLVSFTALGVLMCFGLSLVAQGQWPLAAAVYVAASVGFAGGMIFYDALVLDVSPPGRLEAVSALGYAMGYLGGGLLFAVNVAMVLKPELFGLADKAAAVKASFVSVAIWWAIFTIPLVLFVHERGEARLVSTRAVARQGWSQFLATFRHVRGLKPVFIFLVAYWLYIDGVYTVIKMAVDYGLALGFPEESLIVALLITQFVGFPAALLFGRLGEIIGPKRGLSIGVGVYMMVTVWAGLMDEVWEFYAMAVIIGLVQGGVQALSRSLYARLIPPEQSAEFFGFYNMLGKFAAIFGPLLIGGTAALTGSSRLALVSIILLFAAGMWFLQRVPVPQDPRVNE